MNAIKYFGLLLALCFMAGCSGLAIYGIQSDFDITTDFAAMTTYDYLPIPEGEDVPREDIKMIQTAIDENLQAQGLKKTSTNPSFLIATHLMKEPKVHTAEWGYGYNTDGMYWGSVPISTFEYEEGSLILDFINPGTKKICWRGSAKTELPSTKPPVEEKKRVIKNIVTEILKRFPPKK